MSSPRTKAIKIQTGVVKRIIKEKQMYGMEAEQIEAKIGQMKSNGKDEYEIRKMGEVLAESRSMGPDCIKRLKTAVEDLRNKLTDGDDLAQTQEHQEGVMQLRIAEAILQQS